LCDRQQRVDRFADEAHPDARVERTSRGCRNDDPPTEPGAGKLHSAKQNHNDDAEADCGKGLRDRAETLIGDDCNRQHQTQSRGENKPTFHAVIL
jgi:hypothetical protein